MKGYNDCPFRANSFCAMLSEKARSLLCERCKLKTYRAKSIYDLEYWNRTPVVLVEGFMVLGNGRQADGGGSDFCAREFLCPGDLLCGEGFFQQNERYSYASIDESLCMTACTVALLPGKECQELFATDLNFCQLVAWKHGTGWGNAERHLVAETIYEKVSNFLLFCKENGFPQFTYEEMATACNATRQSVAKAMNRIIVERPDLL